MSTDSSSPDAFDKDETPRTIPCDIWISGFVMRIEHLYLLCGAHGLTKEEIERYEPLPAASKIMKSWRGGVDLIEIDAVGEDGSRHTHFLLILRIYPQLPGREPPLKHLEYKPEYAEILPTIFPPDYVRGNEKYFPQSRLPWVRMPWPLYLCITPCVQRAMYKFTARERERARRMALEAAAKEMSSVAPDRRVASVDLGSEKQGRPTGEPGLKQERGQEDSKVVPSAKEVEEESSQ